jgi:Amidase
VRTQLHFHSATDAAEVVRRKEVSSRELTELLLARIDALNPDVNAVVELRQEGALKEADAADRATADGVPGPLRGVPMTVKESFNVAGLHTTWGNPAFKDYVADTDATVVRRLRQAGAKRVGGREARLVSGGAVERLDRPHGRKLPDRGERPLADRADRILARAEDDRSGRAVRARPAGAPAGAGGVRGAPESCGGRRGAPACRRGSS